MRIARTTCAMVCAAASVLAVETKVWQQIEMSDFDKGTLTKLSLSSEGHISLAPAVKEVLDGPVTFLWAVARDSKGNVYAGGGGLGGSKAKLFVIDPQGKSKTLAELDGLAVQALAIDNRDRVYAATSPDGKVYRVEADGSSQVFYDPKAKYIWALAFSKSGDLFVATGDRGEIHKVTANGAGSVFFKTEETHARSLAVDANGNLIVGTDPDGLILRVTPAGDGFVLYQAAKREITAVVVATDGTIYAAGVGNRQAGPATPPPPPPPAAPAPAGVAQPIQLAPPAIAVPATAVAGGSDIYRIQPDGYARRVWTHAQDLVYAFSFDGKGKLVAGTGNHGNIYRIDTDHSYVRLLNVPSTQVTGLATAPDGKMFAVTGNIGKVFSVGPDLESTGTFESDVLDAGAFSTWGHFMQQPELSARGIVIETRSGNVNHAQSNWSSWQRLNAGRIVSPAARFLQYRATFSGPAELTEVDVAYLMKNIAPVIEVVETTSANYKFPAPAVAAATPANPTLTLPPLGRKPPASAAASGDTGNSPALTYAKGQIGARWLANDENGDAMLFKVEIRGVNEQGWKLVRDKIREHYASWDSTAFPDGRYVVRVTVTDAPSNPPDQALSSSRETDSFLIDNTPPELTGLTGAVANGKIELRFHAKDALSWISKAEYSINGGDWLVVEPTTQLTDSQEHDYRVLIDRGQGETTVAVRVSDEFDNQSVAKTVVR